MASSKLLNGSFKREVLESVPVSIEPVLRKVLTDQYGVADDVNIITQIDTSDDRRVACIRIGLTGQRLLRLFLYDFGFPILLIDEWYSNYITFNETSQEKLDVAIQRGLDLVCVELEYTTCMLREPAYPPSERLEELGYTKLIELPGDNNKRKLPSIFYREVVEKERRPDSTVGEFVEAVNSTRGSEIKVAYFGGKIKSNGNL